MYIHRKKEMYVLYNREKEIIYIYIYMNIHREEKLQFSLYMCIYFKEI